MFWYAWIFDAQGGSHTLSLATSTCCPLLSGMRHLHILENIYLFASFGMAFVSRFQWRLSIKFYLGLWHLKISAFVGYHLVWFCNVNHRFWPSGLTRIPSNSTQPVLILSHYVKLNSAWMSCGWHLVDLSGFLLTLTWPTRRYIALHIKKCM